MTPASILLYSAERALTPEHQAIHAGAATLYIRAVATALDVGAALDAAEPLEGEIVLNTIPAEALLPRYIYRTAAGDAVDTDSEAVAVITDTLHRCEWAALPLCEGQKLTHAEALEAAAKLELLGTGWQLMSIADFDTVKDLTAFEPAVLEPFRRWPAYAWAWTRDNVAAPDCADCAWGVYLGHGHSYLAHRYYHGVALACRPVPGASPRQ
jgi:hypothetical protein